MFEKFSLQDLSAPSKQFAMSPIPGPTAPTSASLLARMFGVRSVPSLGVLSTYIGSVSNIPIVERSWGLLGDAKVYGPKFRYSEYMKTRNIVTGLFLHFGLMFAGLLCAIKPFRSLVKLFVYSPGQGPAVEETKNDRFEYRAVGYPDLAEKNPPRAYSRATYSGSMYHCEYIRSKALQ